MTVQADALPTKRFFIDTITRDITLEDAILDLIDNSIDSLSRTRNIDVSERLLFDQESGTPRAQACIDINFSEQKFQIKDNCGGIDYETAKHNVFRFGSVIEGQRGSLSVYGIGLKRAIFKIGRQVTVESRTRESGFRVQIDADDWLKQDDPQSWSFPIERIEPAGNDASAGTTITIEGLKSEVQMRLNDGSLDRRLTDSIANTYPLFLNRYVVVTYNDTKIDPRQIPIGLSDQIEPGFKRIQKDGVTVTILVGLAERSQWNVDTAGWYIFCNGRVVVLADKTDLTDWGVRLPQFVSKHRGFLGLVFFFSDDPEQLPWTTTKRGLHREAPIYQIVRTEMVLEARPVLNFLNSMYQTDYSGDESDEQPNERELAQTVKTASLSAIASKGESEFKVVPGKKARRTTVSIQYTVEKKDLERAKSCIGRRSWSAKRIGKHAFEYFLKEECPE